MAPFYDYPPLSGGKRITWFGRQLPDHIASVELAPIPDSFQDKVVWLTRDGRRFEFELNDLTADEVIDAVVAAMELSC